MGQKYMMFLLLFLCNILWVESREVFVKADDGDCKEKNGTEEDRFCFTTYLELHQNEGDIIYMASGTYKNGTSSRPTQYPYLNFKMENFTIIGMSDKSTWISGAMFEFSKNLNNVVLKDIVFSGSIMFAIRNKVINEFVVDGCEGRTSPFTRLSSFSILHMESNSIKGQVWIKDTIFDAKLISTPIMTFRNMESSKLLLTDVNIVYDRENIGNKIVIDNVFGINFERLSISNTALYIKDSNNIHIENSTFDKLGIFIQGSSEISITNNTFNNIGFSTFQLDANTFYPLSIKLTNTKSNINLANITIKNNTFSNFKYIELDPQSLAAIYFSQPFSTEETYNLTNYLIIHNNFKLNNKIYAIINVMDAPVIARYNHFGGINGPTDECNAKGNGPLIYPNSSYEKGFKIEYSPWCKDEDCTDISKEIKCPIPKEVILRMFLIIFCFCCGVIIITLFIIFCIKNIKRQKYKDQAYKVLKERLNKTYNSFDDPITNYPTNEIEKLFQENNIKRINFKDIVFGQLIGKGSYGMVYQATIGDEKVAVKELNDESLVSDKILKEFICEIKIMCTVQHQNLLSVIGVSVCDTETPPKIYLLSPLLRGSLSTVLHGSNANMRMNFNRKIKICQDVVEGMDYLHRLDPPIVHRDLKPGNILVDSNWNAKVADFGISMSLEKQSKTMTLRGTALYLAPETILNGRYSTKSDVFAFGITMCEIFTEILPYSDLTEENPARLMIRIACDRIRPIMPNNSTVVPLIEDCLEHEARERPTFHEIAVEMKRIREYKNLIN